MFSGGQLCNGTLFLNGLNLTATHESTLIMQKAITASAWLIYLIDSISNVFEGWNKLFSKSNAGISELANWSLTLANSDM